jgi:N-acetylmuramic acid 6-phosphate (MurNAc-6-P) etherase
MAEGSITETPNEITDEIDIISPLDLLRILRQTDTQIFTGWRHFAGIFDQPHQQSLQKFVTYLVDILSSTDLTQNAIVISGSGTSGRLAFFCSRAFNNLLQKLGKPPIFQYLIAGGDKYYVIHFRLN